MTNTTTTLRALGLTALTTVSGGIGVANIMEGIGQQLKANQLLNKEDATKEEKKAAWKHQVRAIISSGLGVTCAAISIGIGGFIGGVYAAFGTAPVNQTSVNN